MTLAQAYDIKRKEVISLRYENEHLKKQLSDVFPVDEKAALESHIRHLEQIIRSKDSRYESARSFWKHTHERCSDLEFENSELKEKVRTLEDEIASLRSKLEITENEVRELNGTNKKLEKKLNISFENSSLPSSALPFRKKIPNSRKPSGRKPGAQPAHKSHNASRLHTTMEPIYISAPKKFLSDPDIYPTGKQIVKQLIDVQVSVCVRDYIADEYRRRSNGSRLHARFPAGIVNRVNYGPSIKALAFLLNNYYNVSIAKTKQCISDITKGIVELSTGMICNLSAQFSSATKKERAKIFSLLNHSDVLYSDATVSNVNGKRKAVILCTNKEKVLYRHVDHKGHDGLSQTPLKNFNGTLVHDHDRSFYSYGSSHQECLAHVLRYLVGAMENEPHFCWHKKMHSLLRRMIHTTKRFKDGIPCSKVLSFTDEYDDILAVAAEEYKLNTPSKEYMDGFNLQKRMREYKSAHLYFLTHPDVDYTNNISERGLRKFKRKLKQAVVLRSDAGGQRICDALSIIESARLQNKNIYDIVQAAFS